MADQARAAVSVGARRVADDVRPPQQIAPAPEHVLRPRDRDLALAVELPGGVELDHRGSRDRAGVSVVRMREEEIVRRLLHHQPHVGPESVHRADDRAILRVGVRERARVEVEFALADHHVGHRVHHGGQLLLRRALHARVLTLGARARLDEGEHDAVHRGHAVEHVAVVLLEPRPERRIVEIDRAVGAGAEPLGIVRERVQRVVPHDDLADAGGVRRVGEAVHQRTLLLVADLVQVHHDLVRELEVVDPVARRGGDDGEVVGLAVGQNGPASHRLVGAERAVSSRRRGLLRRARRCERGEQQCESSEPADQSRQSCANCVLSASTFGRSLITMYGWFGWRL